MVDLSSVSFHRSNNRHDLNRLKVKTDPFLFQLFGIDPARLQKQ